MIVRHVGCVVRTLGETIVAALPGACIGNGVRVCSARGVLAGEVAAVERSRVAIVPFGSLSGVAVGDRVEIDDAARAAPLGFAALGRALDAAGAALDGAGALRTRSVRVDRVGPEPRERRGIREPFWTGVRALDGLLTIGRGARIGFFGAPGAGKTTLLESIATAARADAVVLALVGERGREAQAWIDRCDARTTIVCATSDRSASERVRAADVAMAQACLLRDRGLHVALIVDSLARYCAALREQRVALGEAVGRGGYPPSVWAALARFLECAGNAHDGSITVLATVLSDGADEREPLSDAARSLLDGHIMLSSALARAGHFPAIDVLGSASRTMDAVTDASHLADAGAVRAVLALLAESKDARDVGLAAMTPALAAAVAAEPALMAFLRQGAPANPQEVRQELRAVAASLGVLA
ncbi:MAG: EscN/YscN/HrcN family type III secretion system ATPase [Candidatus Eremiobacteraeota bacterium]|nr:EscN/YscN/HrcN family type III secretion system ATPase [Candidatus Eremiobacteraeota bacterium]MBC5801532.1 EscN/YscN/HrcN family type III secretion system ATPase [Candidatus Eremiobacteraeota bacterium]MBC5821075.1 EscN/YscN/HrcN family type III secretion system ATPase [Candidatus Eremiobacteraeota bacterium]